MARLSAAAPNPPARVWTARRGCACGAAAPCKGCNNGVGVKTRFHVSIFLGRGTSSLSDVGIVGCKSTAAVYFSPLSYPISRYWDAKSAKTILAGADFRFRRPKSDRLLGLDIRAGLHTGEVETTGEKVSGLAVHIGARVMSHAGAGEVLVSSTVRDLVAGSDIGFEERGSHALKGVPGEWRLYRALAD